jgi:hypothetical protein
MSGRVEAEWAPKPKTEALIRSVALVTRRTTKASSIGKIMVSFHCIQRRLGFVFLISILQLRCVLARKSSGVELTGVWATEPYESQLGKSVDTLCFNADGTAASLLQTQAGPISMKGRYSLVGDALTLNFKDAAYGPVTVAVRITDNDMRIEYDTVARLYRRVPPPCPVP